MGGEEGEGLKSPSPNPIAGEEAVKEGQRETMDGSKEVKEGAKEGKSAPMKFSLGKMKGASKVQRKPQDKKDEDSEQRELITAVDFTGLVAKDDSKSKRGPKIISPLEDTWKPEKRMKSVNPEMEEIMGGPENKFDMGTSGSLPGGGEGKEGVDGTDESSGGVRYGLTVRSAPERVEDRDQRPIMDPETQKLQEDLDRLPDEANLDAYESMPVEDFGVALLTGMGWQKGKPIGRNAKGLAEPVEFVPRQGRLGLGATPKLLENNKKLIKPGETRGPKPDLVAPTGPDGKVRHVKPISEKLVERVRPGPVKGKVMRIVEGRHEGLSGTVLEVVEMGEGKGVQVRMVLVGSEEVIVVKGKEVADLGSWEEEQAMMRIRGEEGRDGEERMVRENGSARRRKVVERAEGEDGERNREGRKRDERDEKKDEKVYASVDRDRDSERERGKGRERDRERKRDEDRERDRENERDRARVKDRGTGRDRDRDENRDSNRIRDRDRDRDRDSDRDRDRGRDRRSNRERDSREEGKVKGKREQAPSKQGAAREPSRSPPPLPPSSRRPWLMPHIRVRIVDKRIHGGRLYLKKGTIVDVVTPTTCDVLLDPGSSEAGDRSGNGVSSRGNLVQGLKEQEVETALPKKGGRVMILSGPNRGQVGKLLERRGEEGVAVVQLAESFALERLAMDDVAEYVGELGSYEG
ncbi:hypothetical protein CLOM_g19214 [Closterium sp. NIES-68]|nr:hypothetical protein CLOM_g15087 [Closterium sp. NIES-68]GJP34786.1 hypothetical protein CLOM_g19214 [Closterium sp. NIES-68]GJP72733.1 hypothetical protein CLOP_g3485 [Closterium sp. NIES-67]